MFGNAMIYVATAVIVGGMGGFVLERRGRPGGWTLARAWAGGMAGALVGGTLNLGLFGPVFDIVIAGGGAALALFLADRVRHAPLC